jgi:predicted dithiol-disulfide oxidoreductase (DUF899 family)
MPEHKVGSREEWQAARDELLEDEKELTRRGDELTRKRQELPWVPVEKDARTVGAGLGGHPRGLRGSLFHRDDQAAFPVLMQAQGAS